MATFTGTSGSDSFTKEAVSVGVTSDPPDSLPGDNGDTYDPDDGPDIVVAGDGADFIHEYVFSEDGGDDDFSGGGGNDTIEGGAGADLIDGGADDDRLFGGEESPFGTDNDGGDTILGRGGADYLAGGLGADGLRGGDGNDKLFAERELQFFGDVLSDPAANRLYGGAGDDQLYGALGADRLQGDDGGDYLSGGDGNDLLSGGGDDDSLYGDAGDDRLNGGAGNDYLDSGDGLDSLIGGRGDDTIRTSKYDAASSTYVMSTDSVSGGKGKDTLELDADKLRVDLGSGLVTSADSPGLEQQVASIEILQLNGSECRFIGREVDEEVYGYEGTYRGNGGNDLLQCEGLLRGYGGDGKDTLIGGGAGDRLFGQDGNDFLQGRNGDDFLFGGAGNDRLYGETGGGGNGVDVLVGGAGNDRLRGDYFSDDLYGGTGRDRFEFTSWIDSKYERIDHIRGGAPSGGPKAGAVEEAFQRPGRGKGDLIDVRLIDADESRDGDQPFIFGSQRQGGLWLTNDGKVTIVLANIDRDAAAEFVLYIHDGDAARAEDYAAADLLL